MHVWTGELTDGFDVVVVGSGAAGLVGALAAAKRGATVLVLEKASLFGGTTAVSGGMIWIPLNHHMAKLGIDDDRESALAYMRAVAAGRTPDDQLQVLIDRGPEMLHFVEDEGGARFEPMGFPDYRPEWEGARPGGRALDPVLYETSKLGKLADSLRGDPRPPFTQREFFEDWKTVNNFPWDELRERAARGIAARGRALVGPLLGACADAGVTLVTDARVERLDVDHDSEAVLGVWIEDKLIRTEAGVLLACGGFESSAEMVMHFLSGPIDASCCPPQNTGDGINMAAKIGAGLRNMNEAWWAPMISLPGQVIDGVDVATMLSRERHVPGSIIVNRNGVRFVNEAQNYHDMGKSLHAYDPGTAGFANLPAYLVADHGLMRRDGMFGISADAPVPEWLTTAPTLRELALKLSVDPDGLERTVEEFNGPAGAGEDPWFGRGQSAYDAYFGDDSEAQSTIGPLTEPPFYAIEVKSGAIGTKGGVATTADAQAVDVFGTPIKGLYAAGNTSSHPSGFGYQGAGATIGPGMTMAYVAALSLT